MNSISKKLETLINNEQTGHQNFANYSLKDITFLLKHFGNPHKKIKTIHIAGTNGKGSTAHILNSILITAGYKTGLYTSPNLLRINERIKINNREIANQRLSSYVDELFEVLKRNNKIHPTYFDALTLTAFRYFCEEKTDIAVIEVGLGGRLDSTNVIAPLISIITDISMDHIGILGNTISKIAQEKAGIIKKKSLTITSNTNNSVLDILKKNAGQVMSEFYTINKDFFIKTTNRNDRTCFDFELTTKGSNTKDKSNKTAGNHTIKDIELKIPGKFQIINSSLAIAASVLLAKYGFKIEEKNIKKGLMNTIIPGRFQVLCKKPLIIFDPAHNPKAMKTTLSELKRIYPDREYTAVTSFMTDKDYVSMFKIIKKNFTQKIIYYELPDKRNFKISQCSLKKTTAYADVFYVNSIKDLNEAVIKSLEHNSLLFITGTFRLYGIARQLSRISQKN